MTASRSGRPAPEVYAGVDIGGTTTQVVLCTPTSPWSTASRCSRRPRAAGVVDTRTGRILVASDSFTGWAGFPVTATIEQALGIPAFPDNDVNAFLRGEVSKGAAAGEPYVLGMTLGTGVGGALWMNGALVDGPHGAAGEMGHIPGFGELPCTCGGRGHLETLASGRSITARCAERTGRILTARGSPRRRSRGMPTRSSCTRRPARGSPAPS